MAACSIYKIRTENKKQTIWPSRLQQEAFRLNCTVESSLIYISLVYAQLSPLFIPPSHPLAPSPSLFRPNSDPSSPSISALFLTTRPFRSVLQETTCKRHPHEQVITFLRSFGKVFFFFFALTIAYLMTLPRQTRSAQAVVEGAGRTAPRHE